MRNSRVQRVRLGLAGFLLIVFLCLLFLLPVWGLEKPDALNPEANHLQTQGATSADKDIDARGGWGPAVNLPVLLSLIVPPGFLVLLALSAIWMARPSQSH